MSYVLKIMAWLSVLSRVDSYLINRKSPSAATQLGYKSTEGSRCFCRQGSDKYIKGVRSSKLFSSIIGSLGGLFASWMISTFVFDGLWNPGFSTPILSLVWVVALCLAISYAASRNVLRQKPTLFL